jgi:hypothetical protein
MDRECFLPFQNEEYTANGPCRFSEAFGLLALVREQEQPYNS